MSTSNLTPKTQATLARIRRKERKKEKNRKKQELFNKIVSEFGKDEVGDMAYTDASLRDWQNLYDDLKNGTASGPESPPPAPPPSAPPPKRAPTPKKPKNPPPAQYVRNEEFEEYLGKYRKLSGQVPPIKQGDGPGMKAWYEKHVAYLEKQRLENEKFKKAKAIEEAKAQKEKDKAQRRREKARDDELGRLDARQAVYGTEKTILGGDFAFNRPTPGQQVLSDGIATGSGTPVDTPSPPSPPTTFKGGSNTSGEPTSFSKALEKIVPSQGPSQSELTNEEAKQPEDILDSANTSMLDESYESDHEVDMPTPTKLAAPSLSLTPPSKTTPLSSTPMKASPSPSSSGPPVSTLTPEESASSSASSGALGSGAPPGAVHASKGPTPVPGAPKGGWGATTVPPIPSYTNHQGEVVHPHIGKPDDETDEPTGPYQKQNGGNSDRTNPITPATGAMQTTDTANSLSGVKNLRKMAKATVQQGGPEALYGNARERANKGSGALDDYSFNGPYDYPVMPGGRADDTLSLMGSWRTRKGSNHSSLWYSQLTAKGARAKRNKYYKWSTKGGGNWRKMSKDEMVNVFQKQGRAEGGNFFGVNAGGMKFKDMIHQQLREKDTDIRLGKRGADKMENAKMGWVGNQRKQKRRKIGVNGCGGGEYDDSAHM